jgi:endonuclease YncB( thermonuclease family)
MSIFKKLFCCCNGNITELKNTKQSDVEYFSFEGYKTKGKIVSIYDGDTCSAVFIYKGSIVKYKCRLYGIDCSEMAPSKNLPSRDNEIKQAIQARNEVIKLSTDIKYVGDNVSKNDLQQLLDKNSKLVDIECSKFDKYGRLLVTIISDGININKYLISKNLAKEYYGGTK